MKTSDPSQIIATETGPIKAAIILAALRAAGWEVVPSDNVGHVMRREAIRMYGEDKVSPIEAWQSLIDYCDEPVPKPHPWKRYGRTRRK